MTQVAQSSEGLCLCQHLRLLLNSSLLGIHPIAELATFVSRHGLEDVSLEIRTAAQGVGHVLEVNGVRVTASNGANR